MRSIYQSFFKESFVGGSSPFDKVLFVNVTEKVNKKFKIDNISLDKIDFDYLLFKEITKENLKGNFKDATTI